MKNRSMMFKVGAVLCSVGLVSAFVVYRVVSANREPEPAPPSLTDLPPKPKTDVFPGSKSMRIIDEPEKPKPVMGGSKVEVPLVKPEHLAPPPPPLPPPPSKPAPQQPGQNTPEKP